MLHKTSKLKERILIKIAVDVVQTRSTTSNVFFNEEFSFLYLRSNEEPSGMCAPIDVLFISNELLHRKFDF